MKVGSFTNPSHKKLTDVIYTGDELTKAKHEQGYFNCINNGGFKGNCSKRHNYIK